MQTLNKTTKAQVVPVVVSNSQCFLPNIIVPTCCILTQYRILFDYTEYLLILLVLVIASAFSWLVCYLLKQSESKFQNELKRGKVFYTSTFFLKFLLT